MVRCHNGLEREGGRGFLRSGRTIVQKGLRHGERGKKPDARHGLKKKDGARS